MPGRGYYDYEQRERLRKVVAEITALEIRMMERTPKSKRDTQTIALELLACEDFDRANDLIDELGDR